MKPKLRTSRPSNRPAPELPDLDALNDELSKPFHKFSPEYLDEMAVHTEKGIRDMPVWKDLVTRAGVKEARKILRRGMLMNAITGGNPRN